MSDAVWLCANPSCTNEVDGAGVKCPSCSGAAPTVADRAVRAAQAMRERAPGRSPTDALYAHADELLIEVLGPTGSMFVRAAGIDARTLTHAARAISRAAFRTRRKL